MVTPFGYGVGSKCSFFLEAALFYVLLYCIKQVIIYTQFKDYAYSVTLTTSAAFKRTMVRFIKYKATAPA